MPAHPAFDATRWYAAVTRRRSRRAFDGTLPSADEIQTLKTTAETFVPFEDARVAVIEEAPADMFRGILGSYGRVTGARTAFIFVADSTSPTADEHCGYTGEGLVLEAHALGLGTCWIGGTFSKSRTSRLLELREGEVVRAVSPVGRPLSEPTTAERLVYGQGRPKSRRPLGVIAPGHESWPSWAAEGVIAARVAPSAMNYQPWRFRYDDGSVVLSCVGGSPGLARVDCGIAMLHFELGARADGADGAWETLPAPDVARWVPLG
jgi:nitroreductase